jgi:hypothetical protein
MQKACNTKYATLGSYSSQSKCECGVPRPESGSCPATKVPVFGSFGYNSLQRDTDSCGAYFTIKDAYPGCDKCGCDKCGYQKYVMRTCG